MRIFIQDNLSVLIKRTVIKINEYVHAQAMIWRLKLPWEGANLEFMLETMAF